ncbi:hypothetical protein [Methanobrevibacter oralis]|nr:hypothetical protein [Methanobrevibacter oralis]
MMKSSPYKNCAMNVLKLFETNIVMNGRNDITNNENASNQITF